MIQVPNMLRMKVGTRFGGIDPGAVAKAEAALANLSSQFAQWLQDEIDKLEAARGAIRSQGVNAANANQLYVHCHDLKGLGTTYGFPLITRIAGSLCKLMDEPETRHEAPMFLIDAHIDAIRAAVRDNITDTDHPVGKVLADELEGRVLAYLKDHPPAA
ncbi:MAG: Hpt domain-containing protein [Caulobacterales bacterium 32-69-10]|nr:MAG: Hpt domain-containing protein [Caulobacterales bacterium 32-69-10]